jgi:Uma2 family endonuclease
MVATRQVTVAEFAAMPLEGVWELVDGEPVEMMASGGRAGWITLRIGSRLEQFTSSHHLGWVFSAETGFVLFPDRETVRSPDAAVVLRERLTEPPESFVPLAPDLAVEVLSPTDRMADALGKVAMYLDAGVKLVWLVDPATRTVGIFRPDAAPTTLREGDALDGGEVLPEFTVPVAEIFA